MNISPRFIEYHDCVERKTFSELCSPMMRDGQRMGISNIQTVNAMSRLKFPPQIGRRWILQQPENKAAHMQPETILHPQPAKVIDSPGNSSVKFPQTKNEPTAPILDVLNSALIVMVQTGEVHNIAVIQQ